MIVIRHYKYLVLILALVVVAGVFAFFHRMYHNDMKALGDFVASYETFDKAMAGGEEQKASEALAELRTKAAARISSLIKNEGKAMTTMREIADTA